MVKFHNKVRKKENCHESKTSGTLANKQHTKKLDAKTCALEVESISSCSEVSIRLSPLPSAIVKEYIGANASVHTSAEISHLKSWLNSFSTNNESAAEEILAITDTIKTPGRARVNKPETIEFVNVQNFSTPMQKRLTQNSVKSTKDQDNDSAKRDVPLKNTRCQNTANKQAQSRKQTSFTIFADPCSSSGSDSSTPLSQNVALLSSDAKENLFGFEKLLQPKPFQISECSVSPICKNSSNRKLKKPLQSSSNHASKVSNYSNIDLKPMIKASKCTVKSTRMNSSINATHDVQSDIKLFDSAVHFKTELSQNSNNDTNTSNIDYCSKQKIKFVPRKNKMKPKAKRKASVPFEEPEIAWEEIMNHELVIE